MRGCHGAGGQQDPYSCPLPWGLALSDQANTLHMFKNYAGIQTILEGWGQASSEALGSSGSTVGHGGTQMHT